jgi:DNA-binding NtrC family response regulator
LRVARAELHEGDWLQLGPVALHVEVVDAADVELAIDRRDPGDTGADTMAPPAATEGWAVVQVGCRPSAAALVAHLAARLADEPQVAMGSLLADLAAGLEATAAALLRVSPAGEPVVVAAWGPPSATWPRMLTGSGSQATPPLVWAAHPDPARGALVLAASGELADRTGAPAVLEVVLHLLRARVGPPPPRSRRARQAVLAFPPAYIPGRSPAMARLHEEVRQLLTGDLPVLVTGETGVGKECVARLLHASSSRRDGPFVAVNCAAIPSELLEAELFGIERAVATGVAGRTGKLEQAAGGVLFLDEIGDMPLGLQAKLLRALQRLEVDPVGGRAPRRVDVRVIAATNTDIDRRVADGTFRRDLYYRLAGYVLDVPPLRQRREDIPLLVEHFLAEVCRETSRTVAGVTVAALDALCSAPWPGNVRELEHEVRRLVYRCPEGQAIDSTVLSADVLRPPAEGAAGRELDDLDLGLHTEALERRLLTLALERCRGNHTQAARLLGLSRPGLLMKLRRLGLRPM